MNSSGSTADDLVFEVDIPEDAEYVDGSIKVDGFSQTDVLDLDDAHYDNSKRVVVVEPNSIAGADSMLVDFKVEIVKGVDHDESVETQGQIIVDGQQFLTDGDGDPADGVDTETVINIDGGLIKSLPNGISVYLKEFPSIDPRQVKKTGVHAVVFEVDNVPVAEIDLDLDNDRVIDSIIAAAQQYSDKAFFHGFQSMPGKVDSGYTLLVPWNGTAQVRLCLGAASIDQVEEGCEDKYDEVYDELVFSPGQTIGDITCTIADGFWRCSGVTGSGGQGEGEGGGVPEFSTTMHLLALLTALFLILSKNGGFIGLQRRNFF